MKKLILTLLVLTLTTQSMFAAERIGMEKPKRGFWWKVSAVALAASTMVDAHSSWGHQEINPMLRGTNGRFGTQGVALKALITTGVIGTQYFLLKNNPKAEKYGVITNFVLAGALGSAAAYNYRLHSNKPSVFTVTSNPQQKY